MSLGDGPAAHLLRVTADDPDYRRQAADEAAYWHNVHPLSMEAIEGQFADKVINRYVNERFTGNARTDWTSTISSWGTFRRGAILGVSSPKREMRVLETNPQLHVTLIDLSPGPLERRAAALGRRFPGRTATMVADLNFLELEEQRYDLIVSSSTIHHVTNLEYLAFQINRALTPDGLFFMEDYVGEPRYHFSDAKKRLFEEVYNRDLARQRGRTPGLIWRDPNDLSPFCAVRSDDILDAFRAALQEVQVRTAATLTLAFSLTCPADFHALLARMPGWKIRLGLLRKRLGMQREVRIDPRFLRELRLVGDAAGDAGLVRPGLAFAVYRKRR